MNTTVYANSNIGVVRYNTLIIDLSQFNNALIFPLLTQEFEAPKNYDHDPITFEEEMELMESDTDILKGRVARFSADTPGEDILKHLGLL